ncbi:MAG TPA: dihydrolipoamide acetyltransferase family protein [Bryobacteraceae bacterium]|jgi:pyruvate dehydrogenase E2 component (dihydrolipoamide acetyltransferase)
MALSVVMPALEMAQETGKLLTWLKKEGDAIVKGEPLLEIETDKAVFELEAPGDGLLAGVTSKAGDVVAVGRTIAWIVSPGEQPPIESEPAAPSARAVTPAPAPSEGSARISPKARRMAEERGVDISKIRGTGPSGTITSDDVLAAAAEPVKAPQPALTSETDGLTPIARLMAERTTQSWTQTPHFFLTRDVDAGALVEVRKVLGPAVSITDLLISIAAHIVAKHPKINASWSSGNIVFNPSVNISVAVAVKDGVVSVVIPDAANMPLADIAKRRKDLADRARAGRLRPSDIGGGTFTISNLGMFGVDAFSAIITPPQAAVLAVGRIADRVVPVNGQPGIRPMFTLTLSSDHRVVDGAQAASFLGDLAEAIQEPPK